MKLPTYISSSVFRAALFASLTAVLAACGVNSPEKLVSSAKVNVANHQYDTAIVQLKNALQSAPNNGEARLVIGEAYLGTRDPVSAEKELSRALELGQPHEKVLPLYAKALLEQGKLDAVISEVEKRQLYDPAAVSSTRTALGDAYLGKGNFERASRAYHEALAAVPGHPRARLGLALVAAAQGKVDDALGQTDEIISADPKFAEAYALKSDLLLTKGQREDAKKALERAIEMDGTFLAARFSLISVLIDEKTFDQASTQLESARKTAPRDLRVNYFDGLLAFRKGDVQRARDQVQQVLKTLPNHVPSLVLAGEVELRLNQLASAEGYLNRAVTQAPDNLQARRLLIATELRMGSPDRAKENLQRLFVRGVPRDPQLLLLAGETLLANGDIRQASSFYQTAAALGAVQGVAAKTRLGQIALATGNTEKGFKDLEAASELDAGQYQADLAMITGYLQRQEYDKALTAVQALEKKQPKNPLTFQLYGLIQLAKHETAAARKNFEKALELQPNYLPAAQSLAAVDLLEKKPEDARRRYEALIAKDPKNDQLYLALADMQARSGALPKDVGATIQRAVDANPQSVPARLALIKFMLLTKDAKGALNAAQSANSALPNDPRIVEALGSVQESVGEANQAIETFNRLASAAPQSPQPLYRLAALYVRQKSWDRAIESLRRAQQLVPRPNDVVPQIVQVYMAAERPDDALKEARALQKREPKLASGWALEGDIYAAQKKWPEAAKAYREALKLAPKANLIAIRLHGVLSSGGMNTEADAVAKKWIAENPNDASMDLYLGDRAMSDKNFKGAVSHYQAVLARLPNNAAALNNLALASDALGDAKALGYAERAVKAAPDNPAMLDTLGGILVRHGQATKGLGYLERAATLAPTRYDIRLNYAKALIRAGSKDAARKELETLQAVTEQFPGKTDIPALLKGL